MVILKLRNLKKLKVKEKILDNNLDKTTVNVKIVKEVNSEDNKEIIILKLKRLRRN